MRKARLIAYYLPQFHPIPENDEWWGKGFTEWTNVVKARPLFKGHLQPRIPADLGFYDLRVGETRELQADMARECGVEGFMYWHYWFGNGKQLLQRPFQEVLHSGKPDFPFCLGWANHSWSNRTWTAAKQGKQFLLEQKYPGIEDYTNHFYSLLPAFKDKRYITVDEKPFFLIYNVLDIPDLKLFIETWQTLAMENGLKGIHFVGNIMGHVSENRCFDIINSGVDATALFLLNKAELKSKGKIGYYIEKLKGRLNIPFVEKFDYRKIIKNIHTDLEKREDIYPVVFPQLDRTPRAGKNAVVINQATPQYFKKYLEETVKIISDKKFEHRIVLLNAWNEWGEGNYVEPDIYNGHGYLDAIRDVIID